VPSFDRELIDPTPAAVEKAMAEAVETANLRCRVGLLRADPAAYRKFTTDELTGAPEGVAIWLAEKGRVETFPPTPRATLLGVVWGTTHLGRTVRVAGRRIEPFNEHPDNRFGPPWRAWPALCHLDPDHVVMRTLAGGEPEAIALCGCGAIGPPAKLGWVYGRCGPCHDHTEEHGTPIASGEEPALRTAGQLIDVGFLPSGRAVAAVEWVPQEGMRSAWWDRQTGEWRSEPAHASSGRMVDPSRSAAGVALTSGYRTYWIGEGGETVTEAGPGSCVAQVFEGTAATTVDYAGAGWRRDLAAEGDWAQVWPERRGNRDVICFTVAVAPGGAKVATGWTESVVEVTDPHGGDLVTLRPAAGGEDAERQRIFSLAFSPDGGLLAAGAGRSGFVTDPREEWRGRAGGLYLYDVARGELLAGFPAPNDDVMAVAFSPDGALLFAGSTDCTVRVVDVVARQEVAVLSGHVGGVNALVFSPDGATLASAGGDGLVRLWPWRQLLARPESSEKAKRRGRGKG
jgi:hypothetical protein